MQQLDEHCQAAFHYGGQLGVGVGCLGEGQGPPGLAGSAGALTGLIHLSPYMPYGSLTAVTVTLHLLAKCNFKCAARGHMQGWRGGAHCWLRLATD